MITLYTFKFKDGGEELFGFGPDVSDETLMETDRGIVNHMRNGAIGSFTNGSDVLVIDFSQVRSYVKTKGIEDDET